VPALAGALAGNSPPASLSAALAASFMMFLRACASPQRPYHASAGRRANEWFLFAMSVVMLGAMHAVKFNHLRHHKLCMGEATSRRRVRGCPAGSDRLRPAVPVAAAPYGARQGQPHVRLWICGELAANAAWIAAVFLWLRSMRCAITSSPWASPSA